MYRVDVDTGDRVQLNKESYAGIRGAAALGFGVAVIADKHGSLYRVDAGTGAQDRMHVSAGDDVHQVLYVSNDHVLLVTNSSLLLVHAFIEVVRPIGTWSHGAVAAGAYVANYWSI